MKKLKEDHLTLNLQPILLYPKLVKYKKGKSRFLLFLSIGIIFFMVVFLIYFTTSPSRVNLTNEDNQVSLVYKSGIFFPSDTLVVGKKNNA